MRFPSQVRRAVAGVVLAGLAGIGGAAAEDAPPAAHAPDQLDFSTFFLADIRDSPQCETRAENGRIVFGEAVTNPAITCPDAFAWKLMVESVVAGFWEDWSTNRQTWPSDPWPRCAPGTTGPDCCTEVEVSNNAWPAHCPVFPGPTPGMPAFAPTEPAIAEQMTLAEAAPGDVDGDGAVDWDDVPGALKPAVIGGVAGELTYRNQPMVDYIFDRELYSTDGLARVFEQFSRATRVYAPHWPEPDDPPRDHDTVPPTAAIVFPIDAVMIKANWLSVEDAPKIGIDPYDEENPFIIMDLLPIEGSNKPPEASVKPKPHILIAFHISSKDLPGWFWATFEHVANQGRCDWTGCNDSFGFLSTANPSMDSTRTVDLAPPARNFTPPHKTDKVGGFDRSAFVLGERYLDVDEISPPLDAIYAAFDVATAAGINRTGRPTAADAAWRAYRLKGSQTGFVTATGRPTRLGNSVTEAGFANTSSCITCHARAGATRAGTPPLAIFADTLSDLGVSQSVNGLPNEAWFNVNAYRNDEGKREAPGIHAIQTDFVWGFRLACPIAPSAFGPSWCANLKPAPP